MSNSLESAFDIHTEGLTLASSSWTLIKGFSVLEKLRCLLRFHFNLEKISYSGLLFDGASFLFYNIPSNFASGPSYGRFVFWRFSNFDEIFNFVLPEFSIFGRSFILTFNFLVWGAMVAVCLLLLTFALPWACLRVQYILVAMFNMYLSHTESK